MATMAWLFRRPTPPGPVISSSSTAEDVTHGIDAFELTAIVTGASCGLGAETARVLALRGARVILAVRSLSSGIAVKDRILEEISIARLHVLQLDLSSMSSVREFVEEFKALDLPLNILINNAGVMSCPYELSTDGIELHFAINHIGHFHLTNLLLGEMKRTVKETGIEGRIVNVSSLGHKFTYPGGIRFENLNDRSRYLSLLAYGQSKLANILHALELTRRLEEEGINITANSLHPGSIRTNLFRNAKLLDKLMYLTKIFWKTIPQGAATQCFLALHPSLKGVSGLYFTDCIQTKPSGYAQDLKLAKTLWDFSEKICEQSIK